MTDRQTDLIT